MRSSADFGTSTHELWIPAMHHCTANNQRATLFIPVTIIEKINGISSVSSEIQQLYVICSSDSWREKNRKKKNSRTYFGWRRDSSNWSPAFVE